MKTIADAIVDYWWIAPVALLADQAVRAAVRRMRSSEDDD